MKNFVQNLFLGTVLLQNLAFGNVSSDLNQYFNHLGFSSNVTNPGVIQGQQASYFSGGSLFLRNPVKNMQIVQIQAPSLSAGCGGIDLFGGAFSFVNSDQVVTFAKSMLQGSPGVGFNLAMQVFAPTLSHDYEVFQNYMNQMNNFNLNSCTADYAIAGGLTKALGNNQYACKDLGAQGGEFADWAAGAVGCKDDSAKSYQYASKDGAGQNQLTINTNIVWNALQKQGLYLGDKELAEFMMSLSGTLIFDANGRSTAYPPMLDDAQLIQALLSGGQEATIYQCTDTANCLVIKEQTLTLPIGQGLIDQVSHYIDDPAGEGGIMQALQNDTPLTAKEQAFLSSIPFPLLTYMLISQESGMNINFNQFSETIAYMILVNYLLQSEKIIEQSISNLTNYDETTVNKMVASINASISELNRKLTQTEQSLTNQLEMITHFADAQKRVVGNFSNNMQSNINFTGM